MDDVGRMPASDRAELFAAAGRRRRFSMTIIEKDFWVCWMLQRLFTLADPPAGLIFKGGTSLSKVFNVIERFSEDVDLSFDRKDLGFAGEADPAFATTKKKQQTQVDNLVATCTAMIRDELVPRLTESVAAALGAGPGELWRLELDPDDKDLQTVLFHYPTSAERIAEAEAAYLRPFIRLEMGARGEHWPSLDAEVRPYAAEAFPEQFKSPACAVKVVAAERTFWEKATILHMWYHADSGRHLRDRQSRHYYDVVKLYRSSIGSKALDDLELLKDVARHKSIFFARAWARFDEAVPGTLRLVPPDWRFPELERDYVRMREEMIFGDAPSLDEILATLTEIEQRVNKGS